MTIEYKRVRHLIATTSEWAANSTLVLGDGELGIETTADGNKIKIGDGVKVFNDLPYLEFGSVRSIGLSAPTGFAVDNSPITSSGVLGLRFQTGYSLPSDSEQAAWDTAAQHALEWDGGNNGLDQAVALQSLGLDPSSSPTFHGLVVTGTDPVSIPHIDGDLSGSLLQHVQNDDTVALARGTPVYITGSVGNTKTLKVRAAKAGDPTKMPAFGLIASDVQPNNTGHVTNGGEILSVNTSAFTSGTEIFVGELGGLSQQAPANGEVQVVGCAGRIHASTGTLSVSIGPALSRVALANFGTTPGTVAAGDAMAALQSRLNQFRDARTFYVSKRIGASDTNTGNSENEPFLTIGAAVAAANAYRAANPSEFATIEIGPGTYIETALPMRLAKNILVLSLKQRCVRVKPAPGQEFNSFFAVDSGCMVCDLTFAGHQAQNTSPTDSTVGTRAWAIQFNELANSGTGVFLTASPYIKDCLSITAEDDAGEAGSISTGDCGGGVEVDGAKCAPNSPIRSMVVYGFTQANLGGPGAIVKNEGYAELVSFFGLFGTWHVRAETGGQVTMSGGGCSEFGIYGLMADGYSPTPIFTGVLLANAAKGDTAVDVGSLSANRIGSASRPSPGQLMLLAGAVYVIQSATPITGGFRVGFFSPTGIGLAAAAATGEAVNFRLRSQINAGCHTLNYVGSGTNYSALPWNGGVPIRANETVETNFGRVFGATLNDVGDFKIAGGAFAVDGTTGSVTINTSSFNLSGLNAIGPFSRNGGISTVGVQLQEVSNNANLLASIGVPDGNTAPTQLAVKTYADSKFLQELSATASQPISVFDASTVNAQGFQVRGKRIELSLNIPSGLVKLDTGGLVPAALLPGFVDDVLEFAAIANFPVTGETGKIYISLATNKQYRWSGSQYTEISPSPGSTDSLSEGSVNLYYTTTRVNTWFAGIIASAGTPANLAPAASAGMSTKPAKEDHQHRFQPTDIVIPLTGENQVLAVGTVLTNTRWARDCILEAVPLWSVSTAATGATIQLDIRVAGVSIFATLPTIDAGGLGSDTAAVPAVFSAAFTTAGLRINRLSVVTFHVLQVGIAPNQGTALKVAIPARRAVA